MNKDTASVAYFRERERQERENAEKAANEASRNVHLELAERYRVKAEEAERE